MGACKDGFCPLPGASQPVTDDVNHPQHYTTGRRFEVIDVLEDAVGLAPDAVLGGLQWQTLKYLNRLWNKDDPLKDARKARWYLDRLISKLEAATDDQPVSLRSVPALQGSVPAELFAKIPEPGIEVR